MDWNLAIHRNREALQRIIAALFALAGFVQGPGSPPAACRLRAGQLESPPAAWPAWAGQLESPPAAWPAWAGQMSTALPRHIYHAILRVLRPAEAAVRRLIIIAARDIILKPRPPRPAPVGLAPNPNGAPRTPAFQLIEPLKTFAPFVDNSDFEHIWTDEENDDFEAGIPPEIALPRISVPGLFDPVFIPPAPAPSKFDLINAAHIARRLMALSTALKGLPNQARRLARWQAKRDQKIRDVALKAKAKLHRLSPTRPGRPACPSNQATKSTQSCANATAW